MPRCPEPDCGAEYVPGLPRCPKGHDLSKIVIVPDTQEDGGEVFDQTLVPDEPTAKSEESEPATEVEPTTVLNRPDPADAATGDAGGTATDPVSTPPETTGEAQPEPAPSKEDEGPPDELLEAPEPAGRPATTEGVSAAPPSAEEGMCGECGADLEDAGCPACSARRATPTLVLEKEGPERVRFGGRLVTKVLQTTDFVNIGRRDPIKGIYPDVDLIDFFKEGAQLISRQHVVIERRPHAGKHVLRCLNDNESTHYFKSGTEDARVLALDEEVELGEGDRIVVGEEVGFTVRLPD